MPTTQFAIFSGDRDKHAPSIEAVEGLDNAKGRIRKLAAQKPGKYFVFSTETHAAVANIETFAGTQTIVSWIGKSIYLRSCRTARCCGVRL